MELPDFLTRHKYGEIRLTGHRVGLFHVVDRYQQGDSPEAIQAHFPTLPLDLVDKALAFYLANRAEVDAYVAAYRAELERQEAAPRPGPSLAELQRRLEAKRQGEAK